MDKNLFRFADAPGAREVSTPPGSSSFSDFFARFWKNRASALAAVILLLLLLFALLVPCFSGYSVGSRDGYYRSMPPLFAKNITLSGPQAMLDHYSATGAVTAFTGTGYYQLQVDSYGKVGYIYVDLSENEYARLQQYQNTTGIQVLFPIAKNHGRFYPAVKSSANLWYELKDDSHFSTGESAHHDENGAPIFVANYLTDENANSYHSSRLAEDPGNWVYGVKNQTGYRCRVLYERYYRFRHGVAPRHLLGTNQHGQDILVCLAVAARLSFGLSLGVSALNLAIGMCYGAIEGYYGGKTDLLMERIADILAAIPFIVVATLFQLHLAKRVGALPSLLFSFVLTGWIGIAGRVRTQFYRFKNTEYVLCARTLGATDRRIIFRHILPNAIGTIITSAVLLIPGVIFSESMLSYLGIVNLEAANMTSLGTMLSGGRAYLSSQSHILIFPAIFIALLEISFNLLGNGLREAFDPMLENP